MCAFIGGWAICPWEILAKAVGFLNFMAGYTVFLGPIAGIMISDVGTQISFPTLAQVALVLVRAPWTDRHSIAVQAERPLPVYQWRGMFTYLIFTYDLTLWHSSCV